MLAGGSIGGIAVEGVFWKHVRVNNEKALALLPVLKRMPLLVQTGSLLILLSGLLMLKSLDWMIWGQTWFYIKISLYTLLVLNSFFIARPVNTGISKLVSSGAPDPAALASFKRKLISVHILELTTLLVLVTVTMFRNIQL